MLDIGAIAKATKGDVQGSLTLKVKGVSINTRTLKKGELFVAIKGERFDGHRFVKEAIRKGASAILVSRKVKVKIDVPVIYVKETTQALGDLAAFYRRQFNIPVIGITGSAGKTTAKDLIAHVLSKKFKVLKSDRSENNFIGVPLTLLRLTKKHQCAVVEMGTNCPGEIKRLTQIAYPDVAVLTTIGQSHLEGLKSLEGVWREKKSLISFMNQNGIVLFNADNQYLRKIKNLKVKKKSYALEAAADAKASGIRIHQKSCSFFLNQKKFKILSPAKHNIYAALAAISCGKLFSINYNDIQRALKTFKFKNARFEVDQCKDFYLINDTYNANPVSFEALIDTMCAMPCKGRRILVCSDMLELGKKARELHLGLADAIAESSTDIVFGFGKNTKFLVAQLKSKAPQKTCYFYESMTALNKKLKSLVGACDIVAVKGSRAMKMERVVENLQKD